MRVWFDVITKRDARLLKRWWDACSVTHTHHIHRSPTNPRFFALYRD